MNEQDILRAVGDVEGKFVAESAPKRKRSRKPLILGGGLTAAACVGLAAAVALGGFSGKLGNTALFEAEYPACVKYVSYPHHDSPNYERQKEEYDKWEESVREKRQLGNEYKDVLDGFVRTAAPRLLADDSGQNVVCSPLNLFESLSLLAETTDGETKTQILSLLGTDEAALRPAAQALLNANSIDSGVTTSVLANSVWLGNGLRYNEETLKLLAEEYYTSSYSGEFGSEDYNAALREWLNRQTKGMLKQQADNVTLPETAVLCLASTVYFSARWQDEFNPSNNTFDLFHTPAGDVTAEFMHSKRYGAFCWGERFQAYELRFSSECGGGGVRLILPDEGVEVNDLLADPELYDSLSSNRWKKTTYTQVELSLPKFDVSSDLELSDSLKALGVTDVFSENADFSPLLEDDAALSEVRHAARVVVDEEGTQAAAFTVEVLNGAAPPPDTTVEFTLDRPFIFVVESSCGSTLFMGVVNNPLG